MFRSLRKSTSLKCAAIIDIGSGSVGISIISSDASQSLPTVIWSHREHTLIKDRDNTEDSLREIKTVLLNSLLELGNSGLKALKKYDSGLKITFIQTTLAAPWSHTITKLVNFNDEHPFLVTEELFTQLTDTATKQAEELLSEKDIEKNLKLKITNKSIIDVHLNGYSIQKPVGQSGRSLSLMQLQAACSTEILSSLSESTEKILPKVPQKQHSFMYVLYSTLRKRKPEASEMCIVDITSEATEIGIVRNGVLQHTSHINFGTYTIAREIAEICKISKEEAYTYLKNESSAIISAREEGDLSEIETIFNSYDNKIAEVLQNTENPLSIPKSIFLHTDQHTEDFFGKRFKLASKLVTGHAHTIHLLTSQMLGDRDIADTALAVSQQYFHNSTNQTNQ